MVGCCRAASGEGAGVGVGVGDGLVVVMMVLLLQAYYRQCCPLALLNLRPKYKKRR